MAISRKLPKNQTWLLKAMRQRGFRSYLPLEQDIGVCDGVVEVAKNRIIRDCFEDFRQDLQTIYSLSLEEEFPRVESTIERIDDLFARIEVVNKWNRNVSFFPQGGKNVVTRKKRFLELVTPKGVIKDQCPENIKDIHGVYLACELIGFVRELRGWVENNKEMTDPVTFTLSCDEHKIIFGYIPKKQQWYFVNVNRASKLDVASDEKLAKWIHKAFELKHKLAITTTISTTQRQSEKLFTALQELNKQEEWKRLHELSLQAARQDDKGRSCLHLAAEEGDEVMVSNLIAANANIKATEFKTKQLPLHIAARHGFCSLVEILLGKDKTLLNARNSNCETPLFQAIACGQDEVAKLLLELGANAALTDFNGCSPLDKAAVLNDKNTAVLLIEKGAIIDSINGSVGYTPLHQAIKRGHTDIVELVLKHKANPNAKYRDDQNIMRSPLYLAVENGRVDCLDALFNAGANLDEEFDELMALAESKNNSEIKKPQGQTKNNYSDVINLLKDRQRRDILQMGR